MQRRTFIGGMAAGAMVGLGRPGTHAHAATKVKAGDIPMRVFGKTGEKLTVIGQAGGALRLVSEEDAKAIVLLAYDLGINYFDNAHIYWDGHAEEVYGKVLRPFRKKVFITTKTLQRTREAAEAELHLSLKRLQTDYVDLWQIHSVDEKEEVRQIFGPRGAVEAFEAAKKAGKCRFIGFTGHRDPYVHLEMLKAYDKYDTILMPLHIADPAYLSFEKLVLPVALEHGLGIQGMKNFCNGKLLQSFSVKDCLAYVLNLPIHCTAIGCTTIGQLEDDVRTAQQFNRFTEEQMVALRERAKSIKGPALENWKRNVETQVGMLRQPEYAGG